ncbi:acyl-ACP--UDP-N-acetylglucosamine O-acyltransferase, partial [Duncaniella sp.]|uniref:acyl-ACP--UDP-N-acetylglucosamine O-acyltransferase n=1 Tax=Duncaniella sp. TaxID=2518496 RepID=UPI0023CDC9C2
DKDVEIGDNTVIMPFASIIRGTRLGKNCKVFQGAIVGADPQDFRWKGGFTYCYIGDNVVIRENVIINRGIETEGGTRIGDGCFLMANSHVGHDSHLKGKDVIGNNVSIAGDVEIGECTILSSSVVVHENSRIGDWVLIKGGCRITGNVPPFCIMAHNPTSYFGVNATILRKQGMDEERIDDIAKCYRHIYQTGTSVFNAMRRIEADVEDTPERDNILSFINSVNLRIVAVPRDLEQ